MIKLLWLNLVIPFLFQPSNDSCQAFVYLKQYPDSVINKCDVARNSTGLSKMEKDVVLFTNLVRYNPAWFLEKVAKPYIEHCYLKHIEYDTKCGAIESLYQTLKETPPLPLLKIEPVLNETAAMHADYCSRTGHIGHADFIKRWQKIKNDLNHIKAGENCALIPARYDSGILFVITLLIDDEWAPDYGHRKAILYKHYQYIGVAIRPFVSNQLVLVQHFSLKHY